MKDLNAFFIGVEEALRLPGYIPLISTITGLVRMIAQYFIQKFVGLIFLISGLILGIFLQLFGQKALSRAWLRYASFGAYYCIHATLNFYRGSIELIPVIGNLAVYFYDKGMHGKQLIPYPTLTK